MLGGTSGTSMTGAPSRSTASARTSGWRRRPRTAGNATRSGPRPVAATARAVRSSAAARHDGVVEGLGDPQRIEVPPLGKTGPVGRDAVDARRPAEPAPHLGPAQARRHRARPEVLEPCVAGDDEPFVRRPRREGRGLGLGDDGYRAGPADRRRQRAIRRLERPDVRQPAVGHQALEPVERGRHVGAEDRVRVPLRPRERAKRIGGTRRARRDRDVDRAAGPVDRAVALREDDHAGAGLGQPDRGQEPRQAGPDDGDVSAWHRAAGARPDQAVEPERPPLEACGDHRLLELAALRDRLRAALALAEEAGHRLLRGVADRDRIARDARGVVRHRARRPERAEAALARAHAQPRRPADVVEAARPAPVEDVAEHRAGHELALADQVGIAAAARLVRREPAAEPVVARRSVAVRIGDRLLGRRRAGGHARPCARPRRPCPGPSAGTS